MIIIVAICRWRLLCPASADVRPGANYLISQRPNLRHWRLILDPRNVISERRARARTL